MGLTMGSGPFAHRPAGTFDFEPPAEVTYVEPFPRRVLGILDGTTIVDSASVRLVHHSRELPRWSFPAGDVTPRPAGSTSPWTTSSSPTAPPP